MEKTQESTTEKDMESFYKDFEAFLDKLEQQEKEDDQYDRY